MTPTLQARADARWRAIIETTPELTEAVQVQQAIVGVLIETAQAVGERAQPVEAALRSLAAARHAGRPAFRVLGFVVPAEALRPAFDRLCGILSPAGGAQAAGRVHAAIASGSLDFTSLIESSLMRREDAVRASACHLDLAPDLLWLIAELAASPFANWLQSRLPDLAPEGAWTRGYCPACGSWPALATDHAPGPVLAHCSFCSHAWPLLPRCPYCDDREAWSIIAPVNAAPERRLAWCRTCRGYLKVLAAAPPNAGPMPFPLVAVEDLSTADLDRLAFEIGWSRPRLRHVP